MCHMQKAPLTLTDHIWMYEETWSPNKYHIVNKSMTPQSEKGDAGWEGHTDLNMSLASLGKAVRNAVNQSIKT